MHYHALSCEFSLLSLSIFTLFGIVCDLIHIVDSFHIIAYLPVYD
jgi:hypothetical protein